MSMPGFKADASLYRKNARYLSEVSRPSTNYDRVYMQKPNSQNTPGGSCYGHTSGTTITGTYDSQGRCCIHPANGFPFCIDCDVDKCYDRRLVVSGGFTSGLFHGGVFALSRRSRA